MALDRDSVSESTWTRFVGGAELRTESQVSSTVDTPSVTINDKNAARSTMIPEESTRSRSMIVAPSTTYNPSQK